MLIPVPDGGLYGKIWDTIHKGLGYAFRPSRIRREGRAAVEVRRDEMLMLAQAERDVERIKMGELELLPDGRLVKAGSNTTLHQLENNKTIELQANDVPGGAEIPPMLELQQSQQYLEEVRGLQRGINLQKIVLFSEEAVEEELQKDPSVSNEQVNPDWFARWQSIAQDVSDEQMQRLWGRVLAGEVKQPRTYSLHALSLLSQLSKEDAELIARVANFEFGEAMLKLSANELSELSIDYSDLIYLSDINVLNGVGGVGGFSKKIELSNFTYNGAAKRAAIIGLRPYAVVLIFPETKADLALQVYTVSKPAAQLMKMCSRNLDMGYLRALARAAKGYGAEEVRYGLADFSGDEITVQFNSTQVVPV